MKISRLTLAMCRLVAFVEEETKHALANKLREERYAQDVLKRFQALYPDAVLIFGDFKVGSNAWHELLMKNYVYCKINGEWEFHSATDSMGVKVKTDGTIHLDVGMSEQIFNYVSD